MCLSMLLANTSYETDFLYENVKGRARLQVECCKCLTEVERLQRRCISNYRRINKTIRLS